MRRRIAALLLFPLLAVAAPVPKAGPKIEDVFGEVIDKKSDCKFELNKDRVLTVTVPKTESQRAPSSQSTVPPLVGKKIVGNFELTVRVAVTPPKVVAGKGQPQPAVFAGFSVTADDSKASFNVGTVRRRADDWDGAVFLSYREDTRLRATEGGSLTKPDAPVWVRITRIGYILEVETSGDGKEWELLRYDYRLDILSDGVLVGPVAFGNIDKEFSVTYDEYVIRPLPKGNKK